MSRQITEYGELWVHIAHNVVDDAIMAPCVAISVKCHLAVAKDVVHCLTTLAKLAQVAAGLFPPFQICCSWECVNGGVDEKLQRALFEIIHHNEKIT